MPRRAGRFILALVASLGCRSTAPEALREPGTRTERAPVVVESIFEGGLQRGWDELTWTADDRIDGGPKRIELTGERGWTLTNPKLRGVWGGLVFRFRASATFGDFLEVRLDSDTAESFLGCRWGGATGKNSRVVGARSSCRWASSTRAGRPSFAWC